MTLVALGDIQAAATRIHGVARRTPLIEVRGPQGSAPHDPQISRSDVFGPPLWLKAEYLQPMGAFKIRGAYNMLAQLDAGARAAGVITFSSGNHGQAVAFAAQSLGIPAVVVMPETAPQVKVEGVRRCGAEVIFAGTTSAQRKTRAEAEAAARGMTIVPPFDHAWIIAGAGTCGLEIVEQCPDVAIVYVPVGGGGLLAGVATAVKQLRPLARVVGVEPAGAAKMSASRAAGHPVTLERALSIADGLLPVRPGDLTFAHAQAYVDDVITVSDDQIGAAVRWLFHEAGVRAEPSGAVSVAGALATEAATGPIVAVISGGNISAGDHAQYL